MPTPASRSAAIGSSSRAATRRGSLSVTARSFRALMPAALRKPGNDFIVDDPRGAILALGRKLGSVSTKPVAPRPINQSPTVALPTEAQLIALVRKADDWNHPATSAFGMIVS